MLNKKFILYIVVLVVIEIIMSVIIYKKTNNVIFNYSNSRVEYLWQHYLTESFEKMHLMFPEFTKNSIKIKKDKNNNNEKYFENTFKEKWILKHKDKVDLALLLYRNEIILRSGKEENNYNLFTSTKFKKIFLETTTNNFLEDIIVIQDNEIFLITAKSINDEYNSVEEIVEIFITHIQDNILQINKLLNSEISFTEIKDYNYIIKITDYFDHSEKNLYVTTFINYNKTNFYIITIYTILLITASFLLMLIYYFKIIKIELNNTIKNKNNFEELLNKQKENKQNLKKNLKN